MDSGTLDDGLDLRALGLGDQGLLGHDLRDELIHIRLLGQVEQIDAFRLDLSVTTNILECYSGWEVSQQNLFKLHF